MTDSDDFPGDTPLPPPASEAKPRLSLREQADAAHREVARRHRSYAGMVKREKMTAVEAAVGIAEMRVIRDTLSMLAEHEDALRIWLRDRLAAQRRAARIAAEADDLRDDPAVSAVMTTFPGAEVADVRETEPEAV